MESIAIPLSFLVLVWVFGGLVAASLPLAVGGLAIFGSMAVLRAITFATDVSIFALNLSVAMGLALAIDYTLLILSRFRDELATGAGRDEALMRTMATAGRTVLFSAMTVALSMSVMVLFPMYFLKSFAYAGVAVVVLAAAAAIVVTPAAIALLGPRLDSLDMHRLVRMLLRRPEPVRRPVEQTFFYRLAKFAMRRAIPIGLAGAALLVALGLPFSTANWGLPDDRVLPTSSSARQVGDQLRTDFADNLATNVTIVVPDADGISTAEMGRYATQLSQVPAVSSVSAPNGTFVGGSPVGPPSAADRGQRRQRLLDRHEHRAAVLAGLRDAARRAARRTRSRRPARASDGHHTDQPRHRPRRHLPAAHRPYRHCRDHIRTDVTDDRQCDVAAEDAWCSTAYR